jgi:hypothetical protein
MACNQLIMFPELFLSQMDKCRTAVLLLTTVFAAEWVYLFKVILREIDGASVLTAGIRVRT